MSVATEFVMTETDAHRITNQITAVAGALREGMEKLYVLVDRAKQGNAHVALGYPSWTAYLTDTLGKQPLRLDRDERREVVNYLAGEGMSTRAIGPIVGTGQTQVRRDLHQVSPQGSPEPPDETPTEGITTAVHTSRLADVVEGPSPGGRVEVTPRRPVTGLDGKTYTPPAPREDLKSLVQAAVEEFPDLAYYAETGRDRDVVNMAGDLRRFRDRGELNERLGNLRRAIELARAKRAGTYRPATAGAAASAKHCPTCTCHQEES